MSRSSGIPSRQSSAITRRNPSSSISIMRAFYTLVSVIAAIVYSASAAPASEAQSMPPLVIRTPSNLRQCLTSYIHFHGGVPGYNLTLIVDDVNRGTWFNVSSPFSWQVIVHQGSVVQFTLEDSAGAMSSTAPEVVKHGAPESDDCFLIN
ncbi:hypothetical protein C8Q76DRAFT_115247 [Earliella scabrosa]|nr:hypothetical protein C8Q76DRAFT_115247 [Earliella scabrosa]